MPGRLRRAQHVVEVREISAADHHAAEQHHRSKRRAQRIEALAKTPPIERLGRERASAIGSARQLGLVVGPGWYERVARFRVRLEEGEHLGTRREEGFGARIWEQDVSLFEKLAFMARREGR